MHQQPRGFVLVIILIVAIAAAMIAATLLSSATASKIATDHTASGEVADMLAKAGMDRAQTYLSTVDKVSGDFDLALDPTLAANCGPLPAGPPTCPGNTCNRPNFTDGVLQAYNGKNYTRVALNGGAYLIRFDDNSDDFQPDPPAPNSWAGATGNDLGGGGNCVEGPGALGDADNPLRDRDRTILVTVIGIAPGTDPVTASHRTTYRRLATFRTPATVTGIEATGNIDAGGGGTKFFACSLVGSVAAQGNFVGGASNKTCTCGTSSAATVPAAWKNCSTVGASPCNSSATCATGANTTPGPASVTAWNDANFDWASPCNFWVDDSTPGYFILWVWDPASGRGPLGNCSAYSGGFAATGPPNITGTGALANCWTPLVAYKASGGGCVSAFAGQAGADLVANAKCEWRPLNAASVVPAATLNATLAAIPGLPASAVAAAGTTYNKPAWGTACMLPAAYPDGAALTRRSCTGFCDGTNNAFEDSTGAGGEYYVAGGSRPGLESVPAGAYYYPGNLNLTASENFGGAPPPGATPLDLADFPLATIVVQGNFSVTGNERNWFGPGHTLAGGNFPSFVVYGNWSSAGANGGQPGTMHIAGTTWVNGNFQWTESGNHFVDGEIHVNGNIQFGCGGTFNWQYTHPLSGLLFTALVGPPLSFVSAE